MKIKANKQLFDRWVALSKEVDAFKSVAQNDMDIEFSTIFDWSLSAGELMESLERLVVDSLNHLRSKS